MLVRRVVLVRREERRHAVRRHGRPGVGIALRLRVLHDGLEARRRLRGAARARGRSSRVQHAMKVGE